MNKRIEKIINNIYKSVFNSVFTKKVKTAALQGNSTNVISAILNLQNSKKYNEFAQRFAKKLASIGLSTQTGLWRKYYEAAKKSKTIVLPSTYSAFQKALMQSAIEENFKMIKSIPQSVLKVYEQKAIDTIIAQVAEGSKPRSAFEKLLKQHGARNAKMIARTETAKLLTHIDESRATSLGSVCYKWLSSKDQRTRKSHRDMNNVVVFWRQENEKPLLDNMRGNAGEFPNCRCSPIPILDENDLTESSYRVYDYRQDKVITLSKKKLLEAIQKGGL